jgi:hypothetical protein
LDKNIALEVSYSFEIGHTIAHWFKFYNSNKNIGEARLAAVIETNAKLPAFIAFLV